MFFLSEITILQGLPQVEFFNFLLFLIFLPISFLSFFILSRSLTDSKLVTASIICLISNFLEVCIDHSQFSCPLGNFGPICFNYSARIKYVSKII